MQAAVVHEADGPEVLRVEELPVPEPRPGWVWCACGRSVSTAPNWSRGPAARATP
jgi:hypothetical protein